MEAVLSLPDDIRSRLLVRFVGHFEKSVYRDTLLRLGPTVELVGFLPQADALRLLDETDFVLLISHDPVNVSAKFYDYLCSGRPIIAAVHPHGDVRRRLDETRAGRWADVADANAIRDLLMDTLAGSAQGFAPDLEAIARYHRLPLAKRYADLLQSLTTVQRA